MAVAHFDTCSAPICESVDCRGVIWYPGEEICSMRPWTQVQKIQRRINKLVSEGKFQNPHDSFTYESLARRRAVSASSSGHKDLGARGAGDIPGRSGVDRGSQ